MKQHGGKCQGFIWQDVDKLGFFACNKTLTFNNFCILCLFFLLELLTELVFVAEG